MSETNTVPEFLSALLRLQYGAVAEQILKGYSAKRPVTVRVNSLKSSVFSVKDRLQTLGIACREMRWYRDALVIEGADESVLQKTDLYLNGEIYLQSLSSMLPPLYLGARAGESVLDMTAAPGGKTAQISALTDGKALITACEKDKIRCGRLRFNLEKQGAPRVTVLETDALKLDDFFRFDRILLDAPCSGSGTVDLRYPVKISEKLIENCAVLQEKLLVKALKLLKKGGELIYSTCSVLQRENENVLDRVLSRSDAELLPLKGMDGLPLLPSKTGTVCVCPDGLYEGFFVAKIRKIG